MTRTVLLLFAATILAMPLDAFAQQGILAPSRRIDWSQAGVEGAIPNRTTVCATLSPGATAAQINSAIAACPRQQVVKLQPGTYNLSKGLNLNNKRDVTLRGAGPDQTFLVFSGTSSCYVGSANVCAIGGNGMYAPNPDHTANWTSGYARGTTSITLSDTTGLATGSILILDQQNDTDNDNREVWQCTAPGVCATEGGEGVTRTGRAQQQPVVVTGVAGNTVTFTPGLYMPNWRTDRSPGAYWGLPPHETGWTTVIGVGIEDLSLDHTHSTATAGIFMTNARDSWVKNVRSINADRAAVWVYGATRVTIRDSYFYGTMNAASQSYGIETDMVSDVLIENNIFEHIAVGTPLGKAAAGVVVSYNYSLDDYYTLSPNWMMASAWHHAGGINYSLFEGNDGIGFIADAIHGTQHFTTSFRNYWTGYDPAGGSTTGKTLQTIPIHIYAFNRYFNFVGNVLGKAGLHNTYETFPASGTTVYCATDGTRVPEGGAGCNSSIYMFGWSGNQAKAFIPSYNSNVLNDPLVRTTAMRWGNYDAQTQTVRFDASEVPTGLTNFANPVPNASALPASFYLSAKPAWWGAATPWPAIGPDVTGGVVPTVAGHVHKIPARLCYENTTKTDGILNFNAAKCYATSAPTTTAPTAPRNLRVIPGH